SIPSSSDRGSNGDEDSDCVRHGGSGSSREVLVPSAHYKVQDPPAGFATWEAALRAWHVPEEEWHSTSAIVDPEGRGPRSLFQLMDTPKPGKNRLHLDLNVSGGSAVSPKTPKSQGAQEGWRLLG